MSQVLKLDFERSQNGGYIVTKIPEKQGILKDMIDKKEPDKYTFATYSELTKWLQDKI